MILALSAGVQVDDDTFRGHVRRMKEALRLSDISMEKACLQYMSIDKNQFRRQSEEMEGHISFTRMMALPDVFWQYYALLLAEDYGLPPIVSRAARVWIALKTRKQLRMCGEPEAKRRTA